MPAISQILQYAPVAQYVATNQISKKNFFYNSGLDTTLPIKIFMVNKVLQKIYSLDTTYTGLDVVAQMLWELMGRWGLTAQSILNFGATATPSSGTSPSRIDFIVSGSSFIADGESSKTISQFIGYNLDFVRGNSSQSTVTSEPTYFTWDKTTGLFNCSPAAITGELFSLIPV